MRGTRLKKVRITHPKEAHDSYPTIKCECLFLAKVTLTLRYE
jgi:hypothetical protein